MSIKKKFNSINEIVMKLKAVAKRDTKKNDEAYSQLSKTNRTRQYPRDMNYRTDYGSFKVRAGIFANSTGTYHFSPLDLHAISYRWWDMLTVINGLLVRNECGYSMQTSMHQQSLDKSLKALGIKPDVIVHTKANIGNVDAWRLHEIGKIAEAMIKVKYSQKRIMKYSQSHVKYLNSKFNKLTKVGIFKAIKPSELKDALIVEESLRTSRLEYTARRRKARLEQNKAKTNLYVLVG